MGNGFARFLAATLITAVVYMVAVIVWHIKERYVMRRFFRTATRAGHTARPARPELSAQDAEGKISVSVG
jgi:hypothetical protein